MTANGVAQIVFYLLVVTALTPPLGAYMARVFEGRRIPGVTTVLGPVERGIFRTLRIDSAKEQGWKGYAGAVLAFSVASFALLYAILRLQGHLPLNPTDYPGMNWFTAFNTAASFVTNTNWQFFAGESTLSYLSQMIGLDGAELRLRGRRHGGAGRGHPRLRPPGRGRARQLLGRPRADHALRAAARWRSCSDWCSAPRASSRPSTTRSPTRPSRRARSAPPTTRASRSPRRSTAGPVASQIAIKQLGTNGGGYYNSNSAVPFENPTPLTNFLELLAIC